MPATTASVGSPAKHSRMNPGSPMRHAEPGVKVTFAVSSIDRQRASSPAQLTSNRNGRMSQMRKNPASAGMYGTAMASRAAVTRA